MYHCDLLLRRQDTGCFQCVYKHLFFYFMICVLIEIDLRSRQGRQQHLLESLYKFDHEDAPTFLLPTTAFSDIPARPLCKQQRLC